MRTMVLGLTALLIAGAAQAADPQPLPTGETWVADAIDGKPIADGSTATLRFEGGQARGKATCNMYGGPYRLVEGKLDVGPLSGTKLACPPMLAEQEARFLAALEGARKFEVRSDGVLVVSGPAGRLTFRAEGKR